VGKYGTNLEGFGAFEGGVNADKGAPLISTSSDGETALLFGPAALREIQAGVANGDFAIPPDAAGDTITAENPLPYWTWTPAALITAAIITDPTAGSTNVFQVSCAAGSNLQTAYLTRFIAVASSGDRGKTYVPVFRFGAATGASAVINVRCRYFQQDQTTAVGTEFTGETASGTGTIIPDTLKLQFATVPSDAAYLKITIEFEGTVLANTSILQEVRVISGDSYIFLTEATPSSEGPGQITIDSSPKKFRFNKGLVVERASVFDNSVEVASLTSTGAITATGNLTTTGTIIGDGVTTDLKHGITLQRTTNLTVNTSLDASATAITWSSAVKNTSLYAYWSSGSTIAIPLTGWYSITCHLISGTGLGTGFAFRLYALVNGTVIAEAETQAGANTTSDTFSISTIAYMTAADSLVFRASASSASKTIGGSRRSACSVVYLGNTSA
jgi:hypothetical protein